MINSSWWGVLDTTLCDTICLWLAAVRWFYPGTTPSTINKTDLTDVTEILLKLTLDTITLNLCNQDLLHVKYQFSRLLKRIVALQHLQHADFVFLYIDSQKSLPRCPILLSFMYNISILLTLFRLWYPLRFRMFGSLYLQLFVFWRAHVLFTLFVFVLFFSVWCTKCCPFLWIALFWLSLRYYLTSISFGNIND